MGHSLPPREELPVPARVVPLTTSALPLGQAAAAFLAQPDLAVSTRRSYQQTLGRVERELGADRPLATLTVDQVTAAVTAAWGGRALATWNRHVATVRSFLGFCRRRRWVSDDLTVDLERRREPADCTKAIPLAELERLWRRDDLGVREKALWRLLYETAARATEALSINVEDLRPYFGSRQLRQITPSHVLRRQHELEQRLSHSGVMACRSILGRILEAARKERLIATNPVREVEAPKPRLSALLPRPLPHSGRHRAAQRRAAGPAPPPSLPRAGPHRGYRGPL
jgi:integrase